MRKGKFILFLSWDIPLFLTLEVRASGSQTFRLRLGFTPLAPLVLRPSKLRLTYTTSFHRSPLSRGKIMGILTPINHMNQLFILKNLYLHAHMCVCIYY